MSPDACSGHGGGDGCGDGCGDGRAGGRAGFRAGFHERGGGGGAGAGRSGGRGGGRGVLIIPPCLPIPPGGRGAAAPAPRPLPPGGRDRGHGQANLTPEKRIFRTEANGRCRGVSPPSLDNGHNTAMTLANLEQLLCVYYPESS